MNDIFEAGSRLMVGSGRPLLCRVDITLPNLSLSSLVRRGRGAAYRIARTGPVAFSVERPGMFAGHGQAERVDGWLSLSGADTTIAALDLEIDPASVGFGWTDIVAGHRPVRALPHLHFRSLASLAPGKGSNGQSRLTTEPNPGILRGLLDIDGTPRLQTLAVSVPDRVRDSITGTEIVSYRLGGEIDLASFALPPEGALFGDSIMLTVRMDVEISPGD
jgi:hypothetical protein